MIRIAAVAIIAGLSPAIVPARAQDEDTVFFEQALAPR